MTETGQGKLDLENRRRRALFRAWHRGLRELDLILGEFADAQIAMLPLGELRQFERLMEAPDTDVLKWIVGQEAVPDRYDNAVFGKIVASRPSGPTESNGS